MSTDLVRLGVVSGSGAGSRSIEWNGQTAGPTPPGEPVIAFLESCEPTAPNGNSAGWLALHPPTLLPSSDAPEMVIFQAADHRWLISDHQGVRELVESTEVRILGHRWRWRRSGPRPVLAFQVSRDEEHVRLLLGCGDASVDLGERIHHQTLLLLARERRSDEQRGVPPPECGWLDVDTLQRMLGIDLMHFNTHVFRARRQLEPHLRRLDPASRLVERRLGQVRFGPTPFTVDGGQPDRGGPGDGDPSTAAAGVAEQHNSPTTTRTTGVV